MTELLSILKGSSLSAALTHFKDLLNLITELEDNFDKDNSAHDAIIDTMIQVLQAHKINKTGG